MAVAEAEVEKDNSSSTTTTDTTRRFMDLDAMGEYTSRLVALVQAALDTKLSKSQLSYDADTETLTITTS